jgi:hypothetical protein
MTIVILVAGVGFVCAAGSPPAGRSRDARPDTCLEAADSGPASAIGSVAAGDSSRRVLRPMTPSPDRLKAALWPSLARH